MKCGKERERLPIPSASTAACRDDWVDRDGGDSHVQVDLARWDVLCLPVVLVENAGKQESDCDIRW